MTVKWNSPEESFPEDNYEVLGFYEPNDPFLTSYFMVHRYDGQWEDQEGDIVKITGWIDPLTIPR